MSAQAWELIFLMFVLKLPIVYLVGVVLYAIRADPRPEPAPRVALRTDPGPEPCPWRRAPRRPPSTPHALRRAPVGARR